MSETELENGMGLRDKGLNEKGCVSKREGESGSGGACARRGLALLTRLRRDRARDVLAARSAPPRRSASRASSPRRAARWRALLHHLPGRRDHPSDGRRAHTVGGGRRRLPARAALALVGRLQGRVRRRRKAVRVSSDRIHVPFLMCARWIIRVSVLSPLKGPVSVVSGRVRIVS